MKIAIVGAGISGASALKAILDHPNFKSKDEIHVFETRDLLGVGLPYGPDDETVMLNVSPDSLSVDLDNPLDFSQWLNENYDQAHNFEDLVSRPKYGKYLLERFKAYFDHPQVTHHQKEVVDLEVLDKESNEKVFESKSGAFLYRIKTKEGWLDDNYNAVFLALGHPPYADYYDLKGTPNYIANPYPMKSVFSKLSGYEKIGVLGSGASGIDLMRFFSTNYNLKHPLTFYVRDKAFYFADIPLEKETFQFTLTMEWINQTKVEGRIPFSLIVSTFKEDLKAEGVHVGDLYKKYKKGDLETIRKALESKDQKLALVHAYMSKLVASIPHLYNSLSFQDKLYYHEHYHEKLLFFKSRVPYKTFIWLFELLDQEKIRIVYGLTDIQAQEDGGFLIEAQSKERVEVLVNASGFDSSLAKVAETMPLIDNLLKRNIILPHKGERFVLVNWPQAQILNQNFGLMDNLFFFGLLMGGSQHENNDAQLTHQLASNSAKEFMDKG